MNETDRKLNENFIKCQTKDAFKSGICLFAGCQFENKLTFNLKRHMKSCEFSHGRVAFRKRLEEVNEITDIMPVNIFENNSINMNIKNSWGCAYPNKIINWLDDKHNTKIYGNKNIVNLVLKNIIFENRLCQSLKLIDNSIHIYYGDKWINNNNNEFRNVMDRIKELWYKKIKQILQDNHILWVPKIPLMKRVAENIGLSWLYTDEHCHKLIDEVLEDQFQIKPITIID